MFLPYPEGLSLKTFEKLKNNLSKVEENKLQCFKIEAYSFNSSGKVFASNSGSLRFSFIAFL